MTEKFGCPSALYCLNPEPKVQGMQCGCQSDQQCSSCLQKKQQERKKERKTNTPCSIYKNATKLLGSRKIYLEKLNVRALKFNNNNEQAHAAKSPERTLK